MIPVDNLLYHVMRGTVKSVPLIGAFLEELLFGTYEAMKRERESRKLWGILSGLDKKLATFEEIVQLVHEEKIIPDDTARNLITYADAVKSDEIQPDDNLASKLKQAFQISIERDPLAVYLADLAMDLRPWRGLGLDRPICIEDIYISSTLLEKSSDHEKVFKESEISDNLFNQSSIENKILIEGSAGMGKSTLLKHWAINLAENASLASERKIPIFLPLLAVESACSASGNWDLSLTDLVSRQFSTYLPRSSDSLQLAVARVIDSGQALILLDGLDEISEDNRTHIKGWINAVRRKAAECPIVVTSRPILFTEGFEHFSKLTLRPFEPEQQKQFIELWFKSESQTDKIEKIRELMEREDAFLIASICGNPLFLTMLCIEFAYGDKLSTTSARLITTPAELIDKFTKILVFNYKKPVAGKYPGDLKLSILESVADYFYEKSVLKIFEGDLIDFVKRQLSDMRSTDSPHEVIKEISRDTGFILPDRYGNWEFSHLLYQEFFSASFHKRQSRKGVDQGPWLRKIRFDRGDRYANVKQFYAHLSEKG